MKFFEIYSIVQAFRCAGLSASQQSANSTPEHQKANQDILRSMASDLIEQYFLPTVSFHLFEWIDRSNGECVQGSIEITDGWTFSSENIEDFKYTNNWWNITWWTSSKSMFIREIKLVEQLKKYLQVFEILSSNKYYGHFKTTPQYLKVLSEIDFTDSLNDNNSGRLSFFFKPDLHRLSFLIDM